MTPDAKYIPPHIGVSNPDCLCTLKLKLMNTHVIYEYLLISKSKIFSFPKTVYL